VKTYDPANSVLHLHPGPETDPDAAPSGPGRVCNELPRGYANRSARTRLDPGRGGCDRTRPEPSR
jgi:hypothetical protein